jgi:hypothetical protein
MSSGRPPQNLYYSTSKAYKGSDFTKEAGNFYTWINVRNPLGFTFINHTH